MGQLIVQNFSVSIEERSIIKGVDLTIMPGQTHVIMGPNGSGKSSLVSAIGGHPDYLPSAGMLIVNGQDLTHATPDKRARAGIFLAGQYPPEIPGVSIFTFLKEAYSACTGEEPDVVEFNVILQYWATQLGIDAALLGRNLHEGFSGGEKKRLELLQMLVLRPNIAILDEIDSGLDVDALQLVTRALLLCRQRNPQFSALIITHYPHIVEHVAPDHVHVMVGGCLVASGDVSVARVVDQSGYEQYTRGLCE